MTDEPDGPGTGMDPDILYEVYALIKQVIFYRRLVMFNHGQLDPYHPVTLVLNCAHSAPRYINTTDILMSDPYPIALEQAVGCDECQSKVTAVSTRIREVLHEIADTPKV